MNHAFFARILPTETLPFWPKQSVNTGLVTQQIEEIVLRGIAAAPGVARGKAFVIIQEEQEVPTYEVDPALREAEVSRLEEALLSTRQQITRIRSEIGAKLGEAEAKIFDAHLMVLEDKALIDETLAELEKTGLNIEHCFHSVANRFIAFFESMDDEYLRERVTDIRDVTKRVVDNLLGGSSQQDWVHEVAENRIIVSNSINASDVALLRRDGILGFVSESGSKTSHAVIMARSMEIPAVVGVTDSIHKICSGDTILIDGYDGLVIINPSVDSLFRYGQIAEQRKSIRKMYTSKVHLPAETLDGKHVRIAANIDSEDDVSAVVANCAEGVGLFRTEAVFMKGRAMVPEDEQYEVYRKVVESLNPREVVIRTIDIGGDKAGHFIGQEDNPFMGFRAIRFCLKNPEIFKEQLRAILRAAACGNVKIMYPMISGVRELLEANALLEEAKQELTTRGVDFNPDVEVGIMIELPSAAYTVDLLGRECSFLSIGTNDLIQYMLAVDRVNDRIAHLYEPCHPAILRALREVISAGNRLGLPVSICGEMASDPIYAGLLIGLGADELSISPSLIPEVKFMVRHCRFAETQDLAERALAGERPRKIFALLKDFYQSVMQENLGDRFMS